MKQTMESALGFFPTDAQAAVVLEPGDHFDAMGGRFGIQGIAVISLFANDSCGFLPGEHEAEEFLYEPAFVERASRSIFKRSWAIDHFSAKVISRNRWSWMGCNVSRSMKECRDNNERFRFFSKK